MTEALWEQMHEPGLVHLQVYPNSELPLVYASNEGEATA